MLKLSPKRRAWPIIVTWNAAHVIRSFVAPYPMSACSVEIKVRADSGQPDASPQSMLDQGADAVVNADPVVINGKTYAPGYVATIRLGADSNGGVVGAGYRMTWNPTYETIGAGEGEQMDFDVVDDLPPDVS